MDELRKSIKFDRPCYKCGSRYCDLSCPDLAKNANAAPDTKDTISAALKIGTRIGKALQAGDDEEANKATIEQMVDRFLGWRLPQDFAPDCGIAFDGRKDDQWNSGKTWPIGTNLLTATQAREMFEYCCANPVDA